MIINRRNLGFTLIELLVVVGIVIILATFAIGPGMRLLKEGTAATQCISNLRQLGGAFNLYTGEHNGEYPSIAGNAAGATADEQNGKDGQWDIQLQPYLEIRTGQTKVPMKKTVYYCPASEADPSYANKSVTLLSYTYNSKIGKSEVTPGVRTGNIENASSVMLLADLELASSTATASYVPQTGQGKNNAIVFSPVESYYKFLATRHKKRMNMLFLDGHVNPRRRLEDDVKTSPPENVRWTPTGDLTGTRPEL